jgi:molecular chaperone GrpE (heat shock protein)
MIEREDQNRDEIASNEQRGERLSTKAMATGAAAAQARETLPPEPPADRPEQQAQQKSDQPQTLTGKTASPLFNPNEAEEFRTRWMRIQTEFVDEPRKSVEEADELVAITMKRLAETFAQERDNLEREWDSGDNISTEDLRIALQRYRFFFDRLLSV